MEIRAEGQALQGGVDAILRVIHPWLRWAHSVTQVSASLPVDNGPVHFLTAIILKYYILLLYPQSIPLHPIQNSTSGSQSSMDSISLPHILLLTSVSSKPPSSSTFPQKPAVFLPCLWNRLSVSLHLGISPLNNHFSVSHPQRVVLHQSLPVIITDNAVWDSCAPLLICHVHSAVEESK